jgi:hypothetical protein
MGVGTYALCSLASVKDYIGTTPTKNGIWIYASSPVGSTAATCEISDTTITLIITGGASAGTKTITFGTSTIADVVAAINAYALPASPAVYPWKAGAICNPLADATDLIITGPQSCLGSANQLTLAVEDNYLACKLVDRATDAIERYTARKLMSRAYHRQLYMGSGNERLILEQYPVTRVFRVSTSELNIFSIKQNTAASFATFTVTPTLVRLNTDGTVTDLTLASYTLISDVVTAINLVSGWECTLLNSQWGTRKATYLGVDGTTHVSELLPVAAAYCKAPILAWGRIPSLYDMTEYWLGTRGVDEERDPGILYAPGGFVGGNYYWIDYQAGFSSTPAALEEACLLLAKYKWDSISHDNTVRSENLGDYGYSLKDITAALPDDVLREVQSFRRISF